jgi:predicted aminopeptidase
MVPSLARSLRHAGVILVSVLVSGCSTVEFYSQAVLGQMSILANRKSVEKVVADPKTAPDTRQKLELAMDVTIFASESLGLPVEDSYDSYVDTGRRYVVWNVFAAPELSLAMKSFCYPIAGCVTYRGFFDEADARSFAGSLRDEGYDVFVGGVAAYSTLGWFDDPILNTFLTRSDVSLAALLFHELAHKVVYVPDDTSFNESFATTVEHVALKHWLAERAASDEFEAYLARESRQKLVITLINGARTELEELYATDADDEAKRTAKTAIIDELRADYESMRDGWGEYNEFQFWMETEINNAKLGTIGNYNDWVESFEAILAEEDGDISRFIERVKTLATEDKAARDEKLKMLAR